MELWNPTSRKRRETLRLRSGQAVGHPGSWVYKGESKSPPCRKKRDKDGAPRFVVVRAYSRFLDYARSSALRMILLRSE